MLVSATLKHYVEFHPTRRVTAVVEWLDEHGTTFESHVALSADELAAVSGGTVWDESHVVLAAGRRLSLDFTQPGITVAVPTGEPWVRPV